MVRALVSASMSRPLFWLILAKPDRFLLSSLKSYLSSQMNNLSILYCRKFELLNSCNHRLILRRPPLSQALMDAHRRAKEMKAEC